MKGSRRSAGLMLLLRAIGALVVAITAFGTVAPVTTGRADSTITVNSTADTTADDGVCTLREAITAANTEAASGVSVGECSAGSGNDTILFDPNLIFVTISLGSSLPSITDTDGLTIDGDSNITISGADTVRIITVSAPLTLVDMKVNDGNAAGSGGAVEVTASGELTVEESTLYSNAADDGGAIYNAGTLDVVTSTFTSNIADSAGGQGGAIYNAGTATISHTTFFNNEADPFGSGQGAGIYNTGTLTLINNTFTGSRSPVGSASALYVFAGTATLYNNVLANAMYGSDDCYTGVGGTVNGNNNLIEDATPACGFTDGADGNIVGVDPKLASGGIGGPAVIALLAGSPAIDAGDNANVGGATLDALNQPRFVDIPWVHDAGAGTAPIVDMGSYEFQLECPVSTELYVDGDAVGGNTGDSWTDAFTDLQFALNTIRACGTPTEVWVAEGLYLPGAAQTDSFNVPAGAALYGGFAGTETLRSQRDAAAHVTILSGDLGADDTNTDGNDIAESTADLQGTNAYHVVVMDGTTTDITSTTVLDGFTITAGRANGSGTNNEGGGLLCWGAGAANVCSPSLSNLVFSGNRAAYGGAIEFNGSSGGNSSAQLEKVIFTGNSVSGTGGAVFNYAFQGTSSSTFTDVTFIGNSANLGGAAANAGGNGTSNPTFSRVLFDTNSANSGGAVHNFAYDGAGVASPTFTNVTFKGNSASTGGAMHSNAVNGTSSPNLTQVTFNQNSASTSGGGIYATVGTGTSSTTITNAILWGDSSGSGPEIYNNTTATSTISYSVVEGDCASIAGAACGAGNLSTDPELAALADNTGHSKTIALMAGSSAIDTGTNTGCPATDQRGISRPRNGTCDIGAYEKIPYVPSDFDDDATTDPVKFDSANSAWWLRSSDATWDGAYLGPGTYVGRSDFDGDGKTDPAKFDANSLWYVKSSNGAFTGEYMGPGTYTFVAGSDYEGDGKTDPAQFNTTVNALWYYGSNDSAWHGIYLGPGTYQYVTGSDFDGDDKSDPAHFDSASNVLWYQQSSDMTWYGEYLGPGTYTYVEASDFDGDGMTDPAQFTSSSNTLWYIPSGGGGLTGVWMGGTPLTYVPAADFDGDGMTDPAGFDSAAHLLWYLPSAGGSWQTIDMEAGTYTIVN